MTEANKNKTEEKLDGCFYLSSFGCSTGCVTLILFLIISFFIGLVFNERYSENKISGLHSTFKYEEKVELNDLFSEWIIEDPYYLNDSAITDWHDASMLLNSDGTFELHKPPAIVFKKLSMAANAENKIIGHWLSDGSHVIFSVSDGTSKAIAKKTNLVTPDNDRYRKGIKILWPLDDNSSGGIIWMKISDE